MVPNPRRAGWLAFASSAVLVGVMLNVLPASAAAAPASPSAKRECRSTPNGQILCRAKRQPVRSTAAPGLLTTSILPNVEEELEGWVEYSPSTCTVVSSGAWAVTTAPQYGSTRTGIVTGELGNGDCPGVQFPFATMFYTWTSTQEGASQDAFSAQWTSPDYIVTEDFVLNLATVTVRSVDFGAGTVAITIDGPDGPTGTLKLDFGGANVATASQTTTNAYAAGRHTVSFDRPSIPLGTYDRLDVSWNASTPAVKGTLAPSRGWRVLGTIRYSQYNAPVESRCSGTPAAVYIVDSLTACNFTPATLVSSFASQVNVNGTGISAAYGTVKAGAATSLRRSCRGHFPDGATVNNSYLQVTGVIGSCNTALAAGTSVATHPTLNLACNANLALVQASNANYGNKTRADTCPACSGDFNGTDGHIDSYSANQACTAHDVGDLGNYWTVQTR